ncbi:MAG: hypothetical protein V1831_01605 [Candidatus Woesearchaeota archaeon]
MDSEYNWNAILWGAVPVSILIAWVFFSNMKLKWFLLVLGVIAAAVITYFLDKKKHNIFTSPFIVFIAALIAYGLNKLF